jgi:DNA-binding protein YbaB
MDIFEDKTSTTLPAFNNISKTSLGNMAGEVVYSVLEGNEDPLEIYIKAKALEQVAKDILSGVKDLAVDEAEKYEKDSALLGVSFGTKSTPKRYSFDHNPEWARLSEQLSSIKLAMKDIEDKMIKAMEFSGVVDEDGVVIEPAKIVGGGDTTIQIRIPK